MKPINIKNIIGVIIGSFLSATALALFARAGGLIPGGIAGITSLLVIEFNTLFNWDLSFGLIYLTLNAIIILFVRKSIGIKFLILSLTHVSLTSFLSDVLPAVKVTDDLILLAVFGGVLSGLGATLSLKMGASSGGLDFISVYFSMIKNKPMWDKIVVFNAVMLVFSGWHYNWEIAFYSIIYQYVSIKIVDLYHDRYKLSSLHIITGSPDEVSQAVLGVTRHGITRFEGVGVYSGKSKTLLYMVSNSFETKEIIKAVKAVDAKAFVEVSAVKQVAGNYRQRPLE